MLVLVLALAITALAAPAAGAATTWSVTKTADTTDGTCNADCSFREALGSAGTGDTVMVPAGTYKGAMLSGNGVWSPNGQYTIIGAGAGKTIIDGNHLSRTFAFYGQITVRGVTVTGGIDNGAGCGCGGGFEVRQGGFLTLEDSVVTGNSSGDGGGIDVDSQSQATLTNVLISQNTTPGNGGGIRVEPVSGLTGRLTMTNVTISGNTTTTGTGTGAGLESEGVTTGTNVTISGNNSAGDGGGVYHKSGTLALNSSTIAGNTAVGHGAGIRNFVAASAVTLRNTIVADKVADDCFGTGASPVTSQGHNIALGASCGFGSAGDLNSTDPKLGPLAASGGNGLLTHDLLDGSPAIDAGDNAACPGTDARGLPRPGGAVCDIGALERQPAPAPGPTNTGNTGGTSGGGTTTTTTPVIPIVQPSLSGRALLLLTGGNLRLTRTRTANGKATCRNIAGDVCNVSGKLTAKVTKKAKGGKSRRVTVTVGTISGSIAGGTTGKLAVKLNAAGRRALKKGLSVVAAGTSKNRAGAATAFSGKLKLLPAKKKKSKHA
jgi:hypothetical protein